MQGETVKLLETKFENMRIYRFGFEIYLLCILGFLHVFLADWFSLEVR